MRITGMATGMDTDATIKQMMKPYTMRVDKMKQDRQIVAWRQELYRDILSDTAAMKNTYFDLLKPDTNILRKSNYTGFDITTTNSAAGQNAGVNVTAGASAQAGNYTVQVDQLAKAPTVSGGKVVMDINSKTLGELGMSSTTEMEFKYTDSQGIQQPKKITGLNPATTTVKQLMDKITEETSGEVKLTYSELTGSLTLKTSKIGLDETAGSGLTVSVNDSSNILQNLGFSTPISDVKGTNAKVKITPPGSTTATPVEKSSNDFSIDGVNYSLIKEGTTNGVNIATSSQKTYDKIKGFIEKYNELVEKVSSKTGENKQYKYLPLSDEQKKEMSEDEIKQWETKAKVGLLKGDSSLDNMLTSMRRAFFDEVKDAGISLSEIGLSTSPDITQRGKIIINEVKLKSAIETKGEKLIELFTKESTTHSSYNPNADSVERSKRNEEQGIFQRISDILQDYTRTTRSSDGKKGILIERAGIKGDTTEFKSLLSEEIIKKDAKINEMIKNLAVRENSFYLRFSKLETAMNKLNSQSSWLAQQMGGGQ